MNALLLSASLWFVSFQAMDGKRDLNAERALPYGGGAFQTKAECQKAGRSDVNDLTIHRPKDIPWKPGFKWTFKCKKAPIKLHSLQELNVIHSNHTEHMEHMDQ